MPDISMCSGGDCPLKHSCYRHTATPSEFRQTYFTNPPVKEDSTCNYYWETKTE